MEQSQSIELLYHFWATAVEWSALISLIIDHFAVWLLSITSARGSDGECDVLGTLQPDAFTLHLTSMSLLFQPRRAYITSTSTGTTCAMHHSLHVEGAYTMHFATEQGSKARVYPGHGWRD
jgi:hypothetical protein